METLKHQTEVKAIKEHKCSFCSYRISKGETYLSSTYKNDGSIYDWKAHKHCEQLALQMKMYEDIDSDGLTQDAFIDIVSNEHDDILIGLFTISECEKFSDVIKQLRYVNFRDKLSFIIRHYNKLEKQLETK